ncbi:hypothetical protein GA0070214_102305 [Micromonospora chaiyaphumensis]|uniref:Transglycosylase SLT domain-containing protein n=1 Tax=Micromonospora chaiyaphumensis TaxID=307119 RepID=A0A1C4VF07_9ACTN|nr:hypothetical protein GA0070214_102305 [Micromonospora chaiyaphumensis]
MLVTGAGDSNGFHLYVARERNAFAWSTLATLSASALDMGPWMGEVCVTGSGRYAVAVFAPKMAANKPTLVRAGGLAAVVDIDTGKATTVATGLQLAYFNPACGPDDRALLTRAVGEDMQRTDLLTVDAAAHRVTRTRRIAAQFTTPAPAADGDYGIARGRLVKVGSTGALTEVARPAGPVSALRGTARSGVDLVAIAGEGAVAQRYQAGRLRTVAVGQKGHLQLMGQVGGHNALVGTAPTLARAWPELSVIRSDHRIRAVSAQGHLLAQQISTAQGEKAVREPLSPADRADAGRVRVSVQATASGRRSTATFDTERKAPRLDALPTRAAPAPTVGTLAVDPNIANPKCAVRRNDPKVQAQQPSADMVEWAVDRAVHGTLTTSRPANYLKSGLPSYSPQGLFPRRAVAGGGEVPAQIMLGILAQETNLSQASWHAVPGDLGNPLIADYYGNARGSIDVINYPSADCGYGVGQVTTGMSVGETVYTRNQQVAIAVDYAANVAAGLNILIEKWNQIYNEPQGRSTLNNNDPAWIENWFLAVWAYNSGYHPSSEAGSNNGRWGIGWLNNPANPSYDPARPGFLRDTYADAETPNEWPYPERIMGWIETPQLRGFPIATEAYAQPTYGPNSPDYESRFTKVLSLPGVYTFCSPSINSCTPNTGNPCPADSEACWWHGNVTFANCPGGECAKEKVTYGSSSAEPGVQRVYDRDCSVFTGNSDPDKDATRRTSVVYTTIDSSQYAMGCASDPNDGKFVLRAGFPAGSTNALYADIDLHQLGAGYQGHMWFSHVYPPVNGDPNPKHHLVGAWTPNLDLQPGERMRFDVVVHLPSHGGEHEDAEYVIRGGNDGSEYTCTLDQGTGLPGINGHDKWVYLGAYNLGRGSQVLLNNMGNSESDGTVDIAWDAMAFVPIYDRNGHNCKDPY